MLKEDVPLPPNGRATKRSDRLRTLPTKGIKGFVTRHLPQDHPLRQVILAEKEELTAEEFTAKMDIWLLLLNQRV